MPVWKKSPPQQSRSCHTTKRQWRTKERDALGRPASSYDIEKWLQGLKVSWIRGSNLLWIFTRLESLTGGSGMWVKFMYQTCKAGFLWNTAASMNIIWLDQCCYLFHSIFTPLLWLVGNFGHPPFEGGTIKYQVSRQSVAHVIGDLKKWLVSLISTSLHQLDYLPSEKISHLPYAISL